MPILDYSKICSEAAIIVSKAAQFIREEQSKLQIGDLKFKDKNDLVSYVDIESEKLLIEEFSKITPGVKFLAEESSDKSAKIDSSFLWIIDPLDGTTNYIHGIPAYCVSVALMVDNIVRVGIVNEVSRNEIFYSYEGGNAFLNDEIIRVSQRSKMEDSLIATGFPFRQFECLDSYIDILEMLMKSTRGIRRIGSAALDLVYVACGRFDGFFEYNLNAWDVAAGAFIVKQAGGKLNDFEGRENYIFGKEIMASNNIIHEELLNTIMRSHKI